MYMFGVYSPIDLIETHKPLVSQFSELENVYLQYSPFLLMDHIVVL